MDAYDYACTFGSYSIIILVITIILSIPLMITYHPPKYLKCDAPVCYYNNLTGNVTAKNTSTSLTKYYRDQTISYQKEQYNKPLAIITISLFIIAIIMLLNSILLFKYVKRKKK